MRILARIMVWLVDGMMTFFDKLDKEMSKIRIDKLKEK